MKHSALVAALLALALTACGEKAAEVPAAAPAPATEAVPAAAPATDASAVEPATTMAPGTQDAETAAK